MVLLGLDRLVRWLYSIPSPEKQNHQRERYGKIAEGVYAYSSKNRRKRPDVEFIRSLICRPNDPKNNYYLDLYERLTGINLSGNYRRYKNR